MIEAVGFIYWAECVVDINCGPGWFKLYASGYGKGEVQCMVSFFQPVRKMMWTPESVKTGPLMSPTLRAKEASSNGFCI